MYLAYRHAPKGAHASMNKIKIKIKCYEVWPWRCQGRQPPDRRSDAFLCRRLSPHFVSCLLHDSFNHVNRGGVQGGCCGIGVWNLKSFDKDLRHCVSYWIFHVRVCGRLGSTGWYRGVLFHGRSGPLWSSWCRILVSWFPLSEFPIIRHVRAPDP